MKKLYASIICILIVLSLSACAQGNKTDHPVDIEDGTYSTDESMAINTPEYNELTESEKAKAAEEQLINRLQAIISELDSVRDAAVSITTSEETGKQVVVSITTETNQPLTDKQKEGIANIVADSVGDMEADSIHIAEI